MNSELCSWITVDIGNSQNEDVLLLDQKRKCFCFALLHYLLINGKDLRYAVIGEVLEELGGWHSSWLLKPIMTDLRHDTLIFWAFLFSSY
jgi:hypothetical protein